jgi:hypothetical protein
MCCHVVQKVGTHISEELLSPSSQQWRRVQIHGTDSRNWGYQPASQYLISAVADYQHSVSSFSRKWGKSIFRMKKRSCKDWSDQLESADL